LISKQAIAAEVYKKRSIQPRSGAFLICPVTNRLLSGAAFQASTKFAFSLAIPIAAIEPELNFKKQNS